MQIIPAIDLKGGYVVRLTQGLPEHEKIYSRDPESVVRAFQDAGATMVHVVDLDGAFSGRQENHEAFRRIIRACSIPVQFGGGLRTLEAVRMCLEAGVSRAIIGTKAMDIEFVKRLVNEFQDKIAVGIDVQGGVIRTHGWKSSDPGHELFPFCEKLERIGLQTVIVTDIQKDGMLEGPNIELLEEFLLRTRLRVILSGGVSCLGDLEKLSGVKSERFTGVIVGKALYENRFSLQEAICKYQTSKTGEAKK